MLRICVFLLITFTATPLAANNIDSLHQYIQANFPADLQINEQQIQQLSWVLGHKNRTHEMDCCVNDKHIHPELARALTRIYCLQLLKQGGKSAYQKFITAQMQQRITPPLSLKSFNILSRHIQNLSVEDYALLTDAAILSAVSLSSQANELATIHLKIDSLPNESLDFLAITLRKNENIYPLVADKRPLYILFPPQTNFRHMLYTEGGVGMFNYLRLMIKHGYIKRAELDLWYAFWIVNIAGFRGHVDNHGSIYLNEQVFQAIQNLKEQIYIMLESPNYNPLLHYLEYRAQILGLDYLPNSERLLLAHLGAMMRLYNKEDGEELKQGFDRLPPEVKLQFLTYFQESLQYDKASYPKFVPALFNNVLHANQRNIQGAITKIIPIYVGAIKIYNSKLADGKIKPSVHLSFNQLSSRSNVNKIVNMTRFLNRISVNANGEVNI